MHHVLVYRERIQFHIQFVFLGKMATGMYNIYKFECICLMFININCCIKHKKTGKND